MTAATWHATILLEDRRTGERRSYLDTMSEDDDGSLEFMWSEGNYACDCNRALFWGRAAIPPIDDGVDGDCTTSHFRVVSITDGDGVVRYREDA